MDEEGHLQTQDLWIRGHRLTEDLSSTYVLQPNFPWADTERARTCHVYTMRGNPQSRGLEGYGR